MHCRNISLFIISLIIILSFSGAASADNVAVLLRGHVRDMDASGTSNLFVNALAKEYSIDLFIHTWTSRYVKKGYGWRPERKGSTLNMSYEITRETLTSYFSHPIKQIEIDDEDKVLVHGLTEGNVGYTKMPRVGWKRMWLGIYKGLLMVNSSGGVYSAVVCARIDVVQSFRLVNLRLEDVATLTIGALQQVVMNKTETAFALDMDIKQKKSNANKCIDNIFVGKGSVTMNLVSLMHYRLDEVEILLGREIHQEKLFLQLVLLHRSKLFRPYIQNLTTRQLSGSPKVRSIG